MTESKILQYTYNKVLICLHLDTKLYYSSFEHLPCNLNLMILLKFQDYTARDILIYFISYSFIW